MIEEKMGIFFFEGSRVGRFQTQWWLLRMEEDSAAKDWELTTATRVQMCVGQGKYP